MKLQSPTLILVFVAIALGGFVAALEVFQGKADPTGDDRQILFEFTEAEVERLTVTTPDQELQFVKAGDQWQMRLPSLAPANEATVTFLLSLIASAESDRLFEVEPENLRDFGFSPPLATIEVELENDDTHQLILGAYDFDRSNIYAQTDSTLMSAAAPESSEESESQEESTDTDGAEISTEPLEVFIVSPSFETAINRPLEDWLQPEESDPAPEESDSEAPEAASPEVDAPEIREPDPSDS